MSEPGWTTGAAPTPDDRDEAQPLTYPPAGSTEGEGEGDAEEGPDGDDPTADPRPRGGLRLNREGRLGLAAALSFLIVVAVLIVNRWRSKTADAGAESGKKPPVLAAAGLIRPEPDAKPEPATAPVPVAAQDSPPAPGAFPPLTGDPAKDGDPGEHVQLAVARNDAEPEANPKSEAPKVTPKTEAPARAVEPARTPATEPPLKPVQEKGKDEEKEKVATDDPATAAPPEPAPTPLSPAAGPAAPSPTPVEMPSPSPTEPPAPAPSPAPTPEAPKDALKAEPANPAPAPTPAPTPEATGEPPKAEAPQPAPTPTGPEIGAVSSAPAPAVEAVATLAGPAATAPVAAPLAQPNPVAPPAEQPKPPDAPPVAQPDAVAAPLAQPNPVAPPAETKPAEAAGPWPTLPLAPPETSPVAPSGTTAAPATAPATEVPSLAPVPTAEARTTLGASKSKDGDAKPAPSRIAGEVTDSADWVPLPTVGKGRLVLDDDRHSPEPAPARAEPEPEPSRTSRGGGRVTTDRASADDDDRDRERVESVPHVVQRGENFWTISQLYYGSGRFFKALWKANKQTVPAIDRLFVGQSLRIPPPEALDRSLIEPPRPAKVSASAAAPTPTSTSGSSAPLRRASSRAGAAPSSSGGDRRAPGELEVALPTSDPFARPGAERSDDGEPLEGPPQRGRPRPILYKVRRHETLRSIARDTLKDSLRAGEIRELNADVISDPNNLPVGQVLKLPEDAAVGGAPSGPTRRSR